MPCGQRGPCTSELSNQSFCLCLVCIPLGNLGRNHTGEQVRGLIFTDVIPKYKLRMTSLEGMSSVSGVQRMSSL